MRTIAALIGLAGCFLAPVVALAEPACEPGRSVADVIAIAKPLVESKQVNDVYQLQGDTLVYYVKALQKIGMPVPDGLSHLVIVERKDGSAALFGFANGCYAGKAQLPPGLHKRLMGVGI